MRLKRLVCLALLVVVVRSTNKQDYKCAHDGYSTAGGLCECTKGGDFSFYSDPQCTTIECTNSGVRKAEGYMDGDDYIDDNQRCSCPPGFLGAHCEPTHCVPGSLKSFDEVSHGRDVSVIITYNKEFQEQLSEKDKNDNLPKTICDSIKNQPGVDTDSKIHFWFIQTEVPTTGKTCEADVKRALKFCTPIPEDKPTVYSCEGELTTDYIMEALENMAEDSRLIILSNIGIQDDTEDPVAVAKTAEGIEAIRKKAISLRTQIHSIVLSPRTTNNNNIYFKGGFQVLRELSESTLGFFINPFDAAGGAKLGGKDGAGMTSVINDMMVVFFEYVVVDRITTSTTSCKATTDFTVFRTMEENPPEFWITVTANGPNYMTYDTALVGLADPKIKPKVDAGYFKGYTLPAIQGQSVAVYPVNQMGNKCVPTTVMVLAKSNHLARFAITNDDAIDASSPYAISGAKTNTLVGHFVNYYHEEHLNKLYLELSNDNFQTDVKKVPTTRDCQYNAKFDDVTCEAGTNTLIRVRDSESGAAVTVQSMYCTEPEDSVKLARAYSYDYSSSAVTECKPSIEVVEDERTLILAAHATNSIYKLFNGNSKSAIKYLNDLEDTGHYSKYVLNIFNAHDGSDAQNTIDYPAFKSKLMEKWNDPIEGYGSATSKDTDCKTKDATGKELLDTVLPLEDILRSTQTTPNSDIIYIIDQGIKTMPNPVDGKDNTADDLKTLHKLMYEKRLRLFVLLLNCSSSGEDFSDSGAIKYWNSVATRTGGFMVHFEAPDNLNEFFASYVGWVEGETAATIDGDDSMGFTFGDISSTPFQVQEGKSYTFLVNTIPAVSAAFPVIVSTSTGDEPIERTILLGNSLSVYEYQAKENGALTVKATASPYFFYSSIRVLDVANDEFPTINFATIGFTDGTCLDSSYPDLSPKKLQHPVTDTVEDANVTMTIFTSDGKVLRTEDVKNPAKTSYPLDYNWRCNDDKHVFYISTDVTTETSSYTRAITTRCFGTGTDEDNCLNGEWNKKTLMCDCPHDYTGDQCDIPVCQNGGVPTAANTCDCTVVSDDYTGEFCEIYQKCLEHTQFTPQYKSIPTTIIFLVEKSQFVIDRIQAMVPPPVPTSAVPDPAAEPIPDIFQTVRAAQYLIVEYGLDSNYTVRISTTDKDLLFGELTSIEAEIDPQADASTPEPMLFDALPAIKAALQAQTTASAHIFWFAGTDSIGDFVTEVFDPIATNRVTISALFGASLGDTLVHPITLTGGSIFYLKDGSDADADYVEFFDKYVIPLLQYEFGFEHRLNMLSISTECNANHVINIDMTVDKIFVSADRADKIELFQGDPTTGISGEDLPGGVWFDGPGVAGEYTIKITHKDTDCTLSETPVNRTSSVSAMTFNQVAYGFYRSDDSNSFMDSAVMGGNVLVTYWLSEGKASAPLAVITPFTTADGAGESTTLYMTVRDDCSYTLSVPINCTGDAEAYGVKITNSIIAKGGKPESKVDKYIPVLCLSSHSCHNGGRVTDDGCDCDDFYGGDFCEIDQCANGERTGGKCVCNTGYSGDFCDTFTQPADRSGNAYLFIQDVCGTDETLVASTQSVYENFLPLLGSSDKIYLATNQKESGVLPVTSLSDLKQKMADNKITDGSACVASIGDSLDAFYTVLRQPSLVSMAVEAAADTSVGKAFVAHVTTVGVDKDLGTSLPKMSTDFLLAMEFVGMTYKNEYFPSPNGFDAFYKFGGDFTQTYDEEVALLDLTNTFGANPIKPSIPPLDKIPRCIKNLQAAIGFHTDISSVPKSTEFRNKAQKIFQSVTKYFDIPTVKTIDIDDETCEFDKSQEENKSLFYGSIYANSSSIINPTFCMSNMDSYPGNVATANYKQADQVTLQSVIDSYTKWYNSDTKMICHCFDYNNENTTKILMWAPLSATSLDKGAVSFNGFKMAGFQHIVLPFGFNYDGSALWRSLVPDRSMWLDDASVEPDVDQIIQNIWTVICRISGRIEEGQTAEPLNPYTTKKPKDTKNNDDSVTPETPDSDGDDLPR